MDVIPDGIIKFELESPDVIKKENVHMSINIKTEIEENNIPSKKIKQELESPVYVKTENENGENIYTTNIKNERDQAIDNQISKILGTTIEEPSLNEESTADYTVNLECLPNIKTEELLLKSENEDSETGSYKNICSYDRHEDHLERYVLVTQLRKSVEGNRNDKPTRDTLKCNEKNSDKEHVCYFCQYTTYLDNYDMASHHKPPTKTHTCAICNYEAETKSILKIHINSKHNKKPDKAYSCDICGYRTNWMRSLKRHMAKHLLEPGNPFAKPLTATEVAIKP